MERKLIAMMPILILFMMKIHIIFSGKPSEEQVEHPFRHLSAWLQHAYPEMKTLQLKQLSRGITLLSSSQKTWKSMDGVAHEVNARVSSSAAITTWDIDRLRADAALDVSKKQLLSDLVCQLRLMRHALRSAEVAELSTIEDSRMVQTYCVESEFEEPWISICTAIPGGLPATIEGKTNPSRVRCLLIRDHERQQLLISIGDSLEGGEMLAIARQLPVSLRLIGDSPLEAPEEIMVNPLLMDCAQQLVSQIGPNVTDFLRINQNYTVHCTGHSFGGSIAALVAGILEGSLNFPDLLQTSLPFRGVASSKISCTTFGAPPCISRNYKCGEWLNSFILGDDLIPRLSGNSLFKLKSRLANAVSSSSGILSKGISMSSALFRDTLGVGMHGTKQHFLGGNSIQNVAVPGRTYYLKPRRYQKSTSLNEVKGSLREDLMWQLDDIFLSKSMLKHHLLESYITNLDRI